MKTYGILGYPLGHSFSKKYFTEKFRRERLEAEYLNFEIEDLESVKNIPEHYPRLHGLNVTIPYKQKILPYLSRISPEAQLVGAVNCIRVERQNGEIRLSGYNTDVFGFRTSLLRFLSEIPEKALILGNGGAAKAVRYVLKSLNIEVRTVSRTPHTIEETDYLSLPDLLPGCRLIVNTTPLGMWPETHTYPAIPYELLTPRHYLFDLVYNPETTEFMKRGAAQGARIRNGLEMLTEQAEAGWKIWNSPLS